MEYNLYSPTPKMIVGFFDADGGFTLRIIKRNSKSIGFTLQATFVQLTMNEDVLLGIKNVLENKSQVLAKERKREAHNSNKISNLDVNLCETGGTNLLNIFQTCPPVTPGKFRDYLIALKVLNFVKSSKAASRSEQETPTWQAYYRLESMAMALLTYETAAEITRRQNAAAHAAAIERGENPGKLKSSRPKKPIETYWEILEASTEEIVRAKERCADLLKPIVEAEQKHIQALETIPQSGLIIPDEYIAGFHLGDGSFYGNVTFSGEGFKNTHIELHWRLAECSYGESFLRGIRNHFARGSVVPQPKAAAGHFTISGAPNCKATIVPILKRLELPNEKRKQFENFCKALDLVENNKHLKSVENMHELIKLIWPMNQKGINRTITLEENLERATQYFRNRRQARF